jgi:hypothetical protein
MLGAGGAQLTASLRCDEAQRPAKKLGPGCPDRFTAPDRGRDGNAAKADDDLGGGRSKGCAQAAHGGFSADCHSPRRIRHAFSPARSAIVKQSPAMIVRGEHLESATKRPEIRRSHGLDYRSS